MTSQDLSLHCSYTTDGGSLQALLLSSFAAFLRRELEPPVGLRHLHRQHGPGAQREDQPQIPKVPEAGPGKLSGSQKYS